MVLVFALPALPEVFIGLAALLILWASFIILIKPISLLLQQIPAIGQGRADNLERGAGAVQAWIASWIAGLLQGVIDLLDWISGHVTFAVRSATATVNYVRWVIATVTTVIPAQLGSLTSNVLGLWQSLNATVARVTALVTGAASTASTLAYIVATRIPAAIHTAVTTAEHAAAVALASATASLQAAISSVLAVARSLVSAEVAARQAADAAVRAAAAAEAAAVARSLTAQVATLDHAIGIEIGNVGQAIDGVAAKVGPWVGPLTIAGTITAITTEVERIARCADPLCNTFSNDLSFLDALTSGAMLGALTALVADAAQHPEAAAQTTLGVVDSVVGGAVGLFTGLTGVRA